MRGWLRLASRQAAWIAWGFVASAAAQPPRDLGALEAAAAENGGGRWADGSVTGRAATAARPEPAARLGTDDSDARSGWSWWWRGERVRSGRRGVMIFRGPALGPLVGFFGGFALGAVIGGALLGPAGGMVGAVLGMVLGLWLVHAI